MPRVVPILVLLVAGALAAGQPAWGGDRTPAPVLQKAASGTQCVEPADVMRRNHMRFLKHQRDDTVRSGVRGARHSLKDCIDCHASPATGSVVKAETDFCSSCHRYVAVSIDCFECHTGNSRKLTAGMRK